MRVLYSFPTRLGTSGIGTTAWHQVAGLAEYGVAVTVVCATLERPLPAGVRVIETLRPAGVKVPLRALGLERALRLHDLRAARVLRSLATDMDVVHAWPLGAERTLATARALGVPGLLERPNAHTAFAFAVVANACWELGIPVDPASPHAARPDRLAREEREYALADHLLCPSDFVARTFRDAGVPEPKLLRHRYGYDPARFGSSDRDPQLMASCSRRAGAKRHASSRRPVGAPFTAGFVGRGEPRKGVHLALEAWRRSGVAGRGRFLVAGAIEPAYRAVLEPDLAHPGVELHGHVDDPAALMRACDVLVLPSLEEGSALVTYEARACGAVLAVSDRTGAPCVHGVDALVHPAGDVDALAGHLRALARDPGLLDRLRAASLDGAHDLTWARAAGVLARAYATAREQRCERELAAVAA